ncbi:MAG: hypothetical protein HWN81_11790 [Candidatus Lokiarchaeota archaeon]|nr:hypothetical protein [Candidatus Lokiarchaeota archaeon]
MKNLNTKSLMVITIVITSIFTMPMAVMGQEKDYDDTFNLNQVDVGLFDGFRGGFGAIFSNNLGYAGQILGSVFEALLMQGLNLTKHEEMESVYILSANTTRTISGVRRYTSVNNKDYYFLPNDYRVPDDQGFAYCEITKAGSYSFELEVGAAVTLIIWDHDKSFVDAINRLLGFFRKILTLQNMGRQISQEVIKEGISVLTWFLIHINDIFTGDELFILNPITWQKLNITPEDYTIEKEWKLTGPDYEINETDEKVEDVEPQYLADWFDNATNRRDNYMEWLLTPTAPGDLAETIWTQFSFDLIQLWIKNFEIHIDINEIISAVTGGGGSAEQAIASAFNGCDIEFYLFTHHLAGAFLYDDADSNGRISANYVNVTDDTGEPIRDEAGEPIQIPDHSELSHRLVLGTVGEFEFNKPDPSEGENSISWGLRVNNVNISAVPMFVDLDSYLKTKQENLEYIYFGFTFITMKDEETGASRGNVKLDQWFAPWNGGDGPNSEIAGLDLAIIYVSTVLHFHLNVEVNEDTDDPEVILDPNEDYVESSHELKVGNYIGGRAEEKLDFVDIAGPFYKLGNDEDTAQEYNASTNVLPLVLWKWELDRHDTFELEDGSESKTYASDIRISTEFDVMVYAACYPDFDGSGEGIWHDPTFSVYMVFGDEGFWALIVLIAGVSLVGVATVLIKRRKDGRF